MGNHCSSMVSDDDDGSAPPSSAANPLQFLPMQHAQQASNIHAATHQPSSTTPTYTPLPIEPSLNTVPCTTTPTYKRAPFTEALNATFRRVQDAVHATTAHADEMEAHDPHGIAFVIDPPLGSRNVSMENDGAPTHLHRLVPRNQRGYGADATGA